MGFLRNHKLQISFISLMLLMLLFGIYQNMYNPCDDNDDTVLDEVPLPYENVSLTHAVNEIPKFGPFQGEKLVHIDLKGAPPMVSYFRALFPYISKLGATGVLMEYDGMFFYKDELENIREKNAYKPLDLEAILQSAHENNLMVIPLIQTFGKLEFVLKLKEYTHLREVIQYPEDGCPTNENLLTLMKKMLDQVLEAHPRTKYIHIGCGEVELLGHCNRCKVVLKTKKWTYPLLYLNYVKNISLYLKEKYPGIRPIIWGDMISSFRRTLVYKSKLHKLVDVMIWKYTPDGPKQIPDKTLNFYGKVFKSIWIASAFKGANGPSRKVAEGTYYLQNHVSWMDLVDKWKNYINFKGIALIGRQRYNHFSELCELLPVGIPSLSINLIYLNSTDLAKCEEILQCDHPLSFSPYTYYSEKPECNFPGFVIYRIIRKFDTFYKKILSYYSLTGQEPFTVYDVVNKFSSPYTVRRVHLEKDLDDLVFLEEELKSALLEIYDQYTVDEWTQTFILPARLKLEAFLYAKELIMEQQVWPTRPLKPPEFDIEKEAKKICSADNKLGCTLLLI